MSALENVLLSKAKNVSEKVFDEFKKNYGNVKESWNNDACMDIFLDYEKCKKQ